MRTWQPADTPFLQYPIQCTTGTTISIGEKNVIIVLARTVYLVGNRLRYFFRGNMQVGANTLQIHLRPLT